MRIFASEGHEGQSLRTFLRATCRFRALNASTSSTASVS